MKVNEEFINEKQCVDDICIFIERKYHKKVSETERGYLVYHIANMTHEHN